MVPFAGLLLALFSFSPLGSEATEGAPESGLIFEGNETFSEAELLQALQRLHVRSDAPLLITEADDAAFFVREFYEQQGYWQAEVGYEFLAGEGKARLQISEGPEVFLGSLEFAGANEISLERLEAVVRASLRRSSGRLFGRLRFNEFALSEAVSSVERVYRSAGYRSVVVRADYHPGEIPDTMDLNFQVTEGPLFIVQEIALNGDIERGLLGAEIEQFVGRPFTPDEEVVLQMRARKVLRDHGYYDAEVSVSVEKNETTGAVRVHLEVEPGALYYFGEIRVRGQEKTIPAAVASKLGIRSGEVFDAGKLAAGNRRLWFTGAFSEANINLVPAGENVLDVEVEIEEGRARQLRGTVGYGEWDQFFTSLTYTDRNFFGTLNRFSLGGFLSQRSYGGVMQLTDPFLFNSETAGNIKAFYAYQELPAYSATFLGGSLGITRQFESPNQTGYQLEYVWQAVMNTRIEADDVEDSEQDYVVALIGGGQTLDRRNDPLSPMQGYLLEYDLDLASEFLGGDLNFFRPTVHAAAYIPFRKITPELPWVPFLMINHRAGVILPYGGTDSIPFPERFYMGGPDSVRSFQLDGMGPRASNGDPLGGQIFWLLNFELQVPIWNALYWAAFVDAGNLSPTVEEYDWNQTRIAPGLGLRFYTPIGAIRVDYGYNLIRRDGDPIGAVQFGFGFNF